MSRETVGVRVEVEVPGEGCFEGPPDYDFPVGQWSRGWTVWGEWGRDAYPDDEQGGQRGCRGQKRQVRVPLEEGTVESDSGPPTRTGEVEVGNK